MLVLYHDWDAFCCVKVRFCLAEKQLAWTSRRVDLQKMEQLTPAYLAVNPKGLVPALIHDGVVLTESSVINEYLDELSPEHPLVPEAPLDRARMRLWVKFQEDVLHPSVKAPTYQLMLRRAFALMPSSLLEERIAQAPSAEKAAMLRKAASAGAPDLAEVEAARARMQAALEQMEVQLAQSQWLAGASFSLADIAAAPFIDRLEELGFVGMWSNKPAVQRWISQVKARPGYGAALPEAEQRIPEPLSYSNS